MMVEQQVELEFRQAKRNGRQQGGTNRPIDRCLLFTLSTTEESIVRGAGLEAGSSLKTDHCFCKGAELSFQDPHRAAHNCPVTPAPRPPVPSPGLHRHSVQVYEPTLAHHENRKINLLIDYVGLVTTVYRWSHSGHFQSCGCYNHDNRITH